MTDIFFSYKSEDRDRVKLAHDGLESLGFEVFWDQEVPAGTDWDSWIKTELRRARSAMVFWTTNSVASPNVRQEATIAHIEGKLIQVLLTLLSPEQFPMGLYTTQAVDLSDWKGSPEHEGWQKLLRELEIKVSPKWVSRRASLLETTIRTEQQKREMAEAREVALEAQVAREVEAQKAIRRERDEARAAAEAATAALEEIKESKAEAEQKNASVVEDLNEINAMRLREVKDAQAESDELRTAMRKLSALPPGWLAWTALGVVAAAAAGGFATGQFMPSQHFATIQTKLEEDLRVERGRRQGAEALVADLERDRKKLEENLRAAKSVSDAEWVHAALALMEAKRKQAERAISGESGDAPKDKSPASPLRDGEVQARTIPPPQPADPLRRAN